MRTDVKINALSAKLKVTNSFHDFKWIHDVKYYIPIEHESTAKFAVV